MTDFSPTAEQLAALDAFASGDSLVIEALAGTGKTSTLRLLAESTARRGRYVAFNKAIVEDVRGDMPDTVAVSTAHSLAFQAVGKRYSHRLNSGRMRSRDIARRLFLNPIRVQYGDGAKTLAAERLAGHVMRAVTQFCQTADRIPSRDHFPYLDGIDRPTATGTRTWENNNLIAQQLEPVLRRAWGDLQNVEGDLPFSHAHYLKIWQLSDPRIETDFILFDEAQDANPVLESVVSAQDHAQRIFCGDANQAIYAWTGAVNAIEDMKERGLTVAQLSQSFRFGPAIAARANETLAELGASMTIRGFDQIDSTVGALNDGQVPDAILCRTNATAVTTLLSERRAGRTVHLVGGGSEVASFAKAAQELQDRKSTWHPELACFTSWGEVQEYVRHDAQGGDLKMLVRLVDDFTVPVILEALDRMPREDAAQVVVSTAHKSKGREWATVQLAHDFVGDREPDVGELRLQYVACTRARLHLDATMLDEVDGPDDKAVDQEPQQGQLV